MLRRDVATDVATNEPQQIEARRIGRGGGIRTRDPLHPMQVRYQAALRPDSAENYIRGKLT